MSRPNATKATAARAPRAPREEGAVPEFGRRDANAADKHAVLVERQAAGRAFESAGERQRRRNQRESGRTAVTDAAAGRFESVDVRKAELRKINADERAGRFVFYADGKMLLHNVAGSS